MYSKIHDHKRNWSKSSENIAWGISINGIYSQNFGSEQNFWQLTVYKSKLTQKFMYISKLKVISIYLVNASLQHSAGFSHLYHDIIRGNWRFSHLYHDIIRDNWRFSYLYHDILCGNWRFSHLRHDIIRGNWRFSHQYHDIICGNWRFQDNAKKELVLPFYYDH